ncbi:MAG: M24 family metallopeptidase, partial [Ruthenibacterium lactatiformans]
MLKNHLIDDVVCEIPVCEYQERLARTKERMKEENFDALIIYSNPWHMSNVFWLSNFRAFDGISPDPALLIVPLEGEPTLFCEKPILPYAKDMTWIQDVRAVRPGFRQALEDMKRSGHYKSIGIVGAQYFALEFYRIVAEVLGEDILKDTDLLYYLKAIKSESEIHLMRNAARLADQSLLDLKDNIYDGMTEREAVQIMHTSLFEHGADSQAFDIM